MNKAWDDPLFVSALCRKKIKIVISEKKKFYRSTLEYKILHYRYTYIWLIHFFKLNFSLKGESTFWPPPLRRQQDNLVTIIDFNFALHIPAEAFHKIYFYHFLSVNTKRLKWKSSELSHDGCEIVFSSHLKYLICFFLFQQRRKHLGLNVF